ncbi:MAG: cell division protein FtsZ [Candidatus Anstonellales archaeon]
MQADEGEGFKGQDKVYVENENIGPKIMVVGVGGAGCNTINRIIRGGGGAYAELLAINTDKVHLSTVSNEAKRILIGKGVTKGLGAGGFPEIGKKCAMVAKKELENILQGVDLLFITAGMGGGTGTGAAPVIAQIAKEAGAIVVSMVTYPFNLERSRLKIAQEGVDELCKSSDTLVLIDNNRLLNYAPNIPIEKAFELVDEITSKAVKGIVETISVPSLINLDFADVRSVMNEGGVSMIAVGEASGVDRVNTIAENTLKHRLLDVDYEGAKGVLLHITGGQDLTLGDATAVGERFTEMVDKSANVTLGARIDPAMRDRIEVIAIFTGVKSESLMGKKNDEGEGRIEDLLF